MKLSYEELEAKCAALDAENAGLKSFGDKLYSIYKGLETSGGGFHDEQSIPYQQAAIDAAISAFEEIKTPATDAFLAEVRAQGVEMCSAEIQKQIWDEREGDGVVAAIDAMEIYAAQLRKGVRS